MVKQHGTSHNREITVMLHSAGVSSLSTVTWRDDNNTDEFYTLIREDVKLLEYTDELPFINTPLHIAASYGNMQYKSLLVYSFYRISVILSSSVILVLFADIDFLRCLVKYDLCQTFLLVKIWKFIIEIQICFLPGFLGHFFLLQTKRNRKSIPKNEAMKFLILLEFSWLI